MQKNRPMNNGKENGRETPSYKGGLEAKLDLTAQTILIIGFLIGILVLVTSFRAALPAIAIMLSGSIAWLVLHGLAEIIRLQKRANNLQYSGTISETIRVESVRCESCGALYVDSVSCPHCEKAADNQNA
jgi:hypothetical protein